MSSSTEFYDNDPGGYSKKTFDADVSEIRDRFLKYVPKESRILDLGCGSGALGCIWAAQNRQGSYTGLDFSGPLLREAERQLS